MGCHAALLGLLSLVVGLASTKGNVPPLPAGQLAGYLTYDQTLHYLQELHAAAPGLVGEPQVIGSSVENRDIPAICIGRCDGEGGKALFTALHHSREPVGLALSLEFMRTIVSAALEGDPRALAILSRRELWVLPVVNPDGYEWNRKHFPKGLGMERKNRRPGCSRTGDTMGVDLNRNYDYKFSYDTKGSSTNPCGEDYRGTAPFSEPEAAAVRDLLQREMRHPAGKLSERKLGNVNVALNWHSYGQVINIPYSHMASGEPPAKDYAFFKKLARRFQGTNNFKVGQAWAGNGLYTVNGDAADYMYDRHGVYAFSPEVGPFFDFEPFAEGMWPKTNAIPGIVNESMALAGQALWGAAPLPILEAETTLVRKALPWAGHEGVCSEVRVQFGVSNAGAVTSDSQIVVSMTLEDAAAQLESSKAAIRAAAGAPQPAPPAKPACPVPIKTYANRALEDDYTHFVERDERRVESVPGVAGTRGARLTEAEVRRARSRGLRESVPVESARQLHGPDGYEHVDPMIVRSDGRIRMVASVQGAVPPAGRATVSMPVCACFGGEAERLTLGECSVADTVASESEKLPGGMQASLPAAVTVVVSDAHVCAAHRVVLGYKAESSSPGAPPFSTRTDFEREPLRHMSPCTACAAHRYASVEDFAIVAQGSKAQPKPAPPTRQRTEDACSGTWSKFAASPETPDAVVLLDGVAQDAAAVSSTACVTSVGALAAVPAEAAQPPNLAKAIGMKGDAAPSTAPRPSTSPAPHMSSPPTAVSPAAVDPAAQSMLRLEQQRSEEAASLETAGWVVAGLAGGVGVLLGLVLFLSGSRQPWPSHMSRGGGSGL